MSNRIAIPLPACSMHSERALIERMIAAGAIKVTRCPPGAETNLNPKRGGGMMPAHLNPLTMGEREDVRA